jgi:hypothetical protein
VRGKVNVIVMSTNVIGHIFLARERERRTISLFGLHILLISAWYLIDGRCEEKRLDVVPALRNILAALAGV